MQVIRHFIPNPGLWMKQVRDFRQQNKIKYPVEVLLFTRILAYLTQIQSVRGITFKFNQDEAIENIAILLGCEMNGLYACQRVFEICKKKWLEVYHNLEGRLHTGIL